MLRKIFMFALTSGLLKKAYDHYKDRQAQDLAPRHVAKRRNTRAPAADAMTSPKAPASRRRSTAASA